MEQQTTKTQAGSQVPNGCNKQQRRRDNNKMTNTGWYRNIN